MVRRIGYEEITSSEADELQIVETLGAAEYERLHLPNATVIPLEILNRDTTERLDPARPVVVYCWDAY